MMHVWRVLVAVATALGGVSLGHTNPSHRKFELDCIPLR
jgi:hypothetical protein